MARERRRRRLTGGRQQRLGVAARAVSDGGEAAYGLGEVGAELLGVVAAAGGAGDDGGGWPKL